MRKTITTLFFLLLTATSFGSDQCIVHISNHKTADKGAEYLTDLGYTVLRTAHDEISTAAQDGDYIISYFQRPSRKFFTPFTAYTECATDLKIYRAERTQNGEILPRKHIFTARYGILNGKITRVNKLKKQCINSEIRAFGEVDSCEYLQKSGKTRHMIGNDLISFDKLWFGQPAY
jgi:hypothetical protein